MPAPTELSLLARRLEQIGAPYMITGATAAIIYGQPRVTNDLDIVLALAGPHLEALAQSFPEAEYYVPPASVMATEMARSQRGHFNLIHLESGYKADIYLVGADPLHAWALPLRRRILWSEGLSVSVAPPEYVVLRKLQYFLEGRSSKHVSDILAIREVTGLDTALLDPWLVQLGLKPLWEQITGAR